MNVKELVEYIQYLETFGNQVTQDQSQFFRQMVEVLKMVTTKLNETLSLFAFATIYNEGELRFPKNYFEIHGELPYGLNIDKESDPDFIIITMNEVDESEVEDDEIDSVSTDE